MFFVQVAEQRIGNVQRWSARTPSIALPLLTFAQTAQDGCLVIDSPSLGRRTKEVPGIETMSPTDVAREAAMLALSREGWDLAGCGTALLRAGHEDPTTSDGATEWLVCQIPDASLAHLGYTVDPAVSESNKGRSLLLLVLLAAHAGGEDGGADSDLDEFGPAGFSDRLRILA